MGTTYLDTANELFDMIQVIAKQGKPYPNMLAAFCQNACEMYFKHLIETKSTSRTKDIMRTHNLSKLILHIESTLGCTLPMEERIAIKSIDGYYFSTRYPDDEYVKLSDSDIEYAITVVQICKNFVMNNLTVNKEPDITKYCLMEKLNETQFIEKYSGRVNEAIMTIYRDFPDTPKSRAYVAFKIINNIQD